MAAPPHPRRRPSAPGPLTAAPGAVARDAPRRRPAFARAIARAVARAAGDLLAALVGRREALPPDLVARYPELTEVRWRRGGLAPRVGGWCLGQSTVHGITLGRTVHLAPGAGVPPALLLHELAHVRQFARDRGFPVRYAWESLRRGYARNRYELEANAFAADVLGARGGAERARGVGAAPPPTL